LKAPEGVPTKYVSGVGEDLGGGRLWEGGRFYVRHVLQRELRVPAPYAAHVCHFDAWFKALKKIQALNVDEKSILNIQ
jgi:hypothetical protein